MSPVLWMLLAVGLMSTMDALAKWLSADFPVTQVVWLRYLFGLLALVPVALGGWLGTLKTNRPLAHVLRGCLGLIGTACFFAAVRLLPLSLAVTIWFTAPILVIVFGAVLLREVIEARHLIAVVLGLGGLVVMIIPDLIDDPSRTTSLIGIAAAFGAASCYALAIVLTRDMAATESQIGLSFFPALLGTAAAAPFGMGGWVAPGLADWGLFAMLGVLGSLGYVAICLALSRERAGALAPYEYSAMVWAVAYDLLVFAETVTLSAIAGAVIIIMATRIAATGTLLPRQSAP